MSIKIMSRKKENTDVLLPAQILEGIKKLQVGDLLYDPWYGFGILVHKGNEQNFSCDVVFYEKSSQRFVLNFEHSYLLKYNVLLLKNATNREIIEDERKEYWKKMFCIF